MPAAEGQVLVLLGRRWGGGVEGGGAGVSCCSCLPATWKVLFSPTPHNPAGPKYINYIKFHSQLAGKNTIFMRGVLKKVRYSVQL